VEISCELAFAVLAMDMRQFTSYRPTNPLSIQSGESSSGEHWNFELLLLIFFC
jgi:hypothetical protein